MVMNLNEQLSTAFSTECKEFRQAGYTDLYLIAGGESHLRSNDGMTPITPQTPAAVSHLVEVLFGAEKARELEAGGQQCTTWQGMRVSAAKATPQARLRVAVRF